MSYDTPGAVRRLPGEPFARFAARQRESQLAVKPTPKKRKPRAKLTVRAESYEDRLDDLGESLDR